LPRGTGDAFAGLLNAVVSEGARGFTDSPRIRARKLRRATATDTFTAAADVPGLAEFVAVVSNAVAVVVPTVADLIGGLNLLHASASDTCRGRTSRHADGTGAQ